MRREFTTVSADLLSVRGEPATNSEPPIDEISQNTRVEVLERFDDPTWVKISYGDGKNGYVNSEHLWRATGLYEGETYRWNMNLQKAANWLKRKAKSNGNYTIVLGEDEAVNPITLSFKNKEVSITLITNGATECNVRYGKTDRSLITVGSGATFTMEEGINFVGQQNDTSLRMIRVEGGTFIMNGGSIKDNTGSSYGGGVVVVNGTFIMNNGSISGNASGSGGGVNILSGSFTMNNGTISGNSCGYWGGGVNVYRGNFTMNNGIISGNKAKYGGGVSVDENSTFIKSNKAGTIYGSNAADNLANKASSNNNGHAVVLSDSDDKVVRVRNSTAWATQLVDSSQRGAAGGWQ
ncbi:hypothetical protein FACS189473_1580 [Spirochaetia bacterium]|nr:hypothetical protein FACS189473_1580 [Spirochaetia bacterium]